MINLTKEVADKQKAVKTIHEGATHTIRIKEHKAKCVTNVDDSSDKNIYSHAPQRIKSAQSVLNRDKLQRFVDQQVSTTSKQPNNEQRVNEKEAVDGVENSHVAYAEIVSTTGIRRYRDTTLL